MLRTISTLLLLLTTQISTAGEGTIRVMPRVDQANLEVRIVLAAWVDSLSVWRGVQPQGALHDRSEVPGSARSVVHNWFSQSDDLVSDFPPTIMSVEPDGEEWVVRTMFSTVETETNHVVPLGILRTWFRFTPDGLLETVQPLERAASDWVKQSVGSIEYRYPADQEFDRMRAMEADRFVQRTAESFSIEPPEKITMFLAPNRDQMCQLFGLEYYAFPPSGIAFPSQGMVFSGLGDPFYPHELAHVVLHPLEDGAHDIIREGVATWLGGSITSDFLTLVTDYARDQKGTEIPSFISLFTNEDLREDHQYILGAVLIDAVHRRHGAIGVHQVLSTRTTSGAMLTLSRMLSIDPSDQQGSLLPLISESIQSREVQPGR